MVMALMAVRLTHLLASREGMAVDHVDVDVPQFSDCHSVLALAAELVLKTVKCSPVVVTEAQTC